MSKIGGTVPLLKKNEQAWLFMIPKYLDMMQQPHVHAHPSVCSQTPQNVTLGQGSETAPKQAKELVN